MEENKIAENKPKAVQCENGHWFDRTRYEKCPHCGALEAPERNAPQEKSSGTRKLGKVLDWIHKKPTGSESLVKQKIAAVPSDQGAQKEQTFKQEKNGAVGSETHGVFKGNKENWADRDKDGEDPIWRKEPVQNEEEFRKEESSEQCDIVSAGEAQELKDIVHQASANEEGKTMGYFHKKVRSEEFSPIEPVVGWLVCVKGPHIGAAYELHAGKNMLGRLTENHVVLDRDMGVSRQCHATVIYEPKKRGFYIQAGDSSGLTYYQEELLLAVSKMEPHSVVGVGETQLMLVPLCGPDFNWEEHLEKKEGPA